MTHTWGKGKRPLLTTECAVGIAGGVEDNRACLPEREKNNASVRAKSSLVVPQGGLPLFGFYQLEVSYRGAGCFEHGCCWEDKGLINQPKR